MSRPGKKVVDRERLDWIQQNPWSLEDCVDLTEGEIVFSLHKDGRYVRSFRRAIDAAIAAEKRASKPAKKKGGK